MAYFVSIGSSESTDPSLLPSSTSSFLLFTRPSLLVMGVEDVEAGLEVSSSLKQN